MASETPMMAHPLKALRPRALPGDCATALGKAVRLARGHRPGGGGARIRELG